MKKKIILFVSIVLVSAICSGIAIMAYANAGTLATTTTPNVGCNRNDYAIAPSSDAFSIRYAKENNETIMPRACGWRRGFGRGWGRGGFIPVTVSQEFKDNIVNIMQNDTDVQQLLADGYNVTNVRPIISATVEGDGTVTIKATSATVTLRQNTTGRAFVWVDLEEGKVTRIEILTRTLIEKP